MRLRRFAIVLTLLMSAITLIAHAQDEQPTTDPTIAAAVSTLIAQTQQAPAQINATQTIQSALEHALTATAQAPTQLATSPTTSPPIDIDALRVASTTELDLLAGPGNTAAYLAPDGEHFAYLEGNSLCLYEGETEQRCVDLESIHRIDAETIRWSLDSRYLVFTEDFFRLFVDSDIWLWDTTTDALQDLTDDGDNHLSLSDNNWKNIDVVPRWLPDGRILFLRYNRLQGTVQPPLIYTIQPDGSGLEKLGEIADSEAFAVFAIDVTATQLLQISFLSNDSPRRGVWVSDLDGSNPEHVALADPQFPTAAIEHSPNPRYALVNSPNRGFPNPDDANASIIRVIDLENAAFVLIDPNRYVAGAGWSPDGSALAYIVNNQRSNDQNGLYITSAPGTPGRLLFAGNFNQPTSTLRQTLTWAANNTILLSRSPQSGIVLVKIAEE